MRRKNLWLRLSSCTMAAMIATTSLPVAAADFGSEVAVESQQSDIEEETVEEDADVDVETEEADAESEDIEISDFSAETQEADLFSDSFEAPAAGEEASAQTGFGSTNAELTKGTYNVTVSLKKTDKTSDSMAASCIAGKGTLKVAEDGNAKLTVPLTSVTVGSTTAWASEWKIYKNYESETDKGLTDAESAADAEGHVNSITFDIPDKTQDGVFVNMKSGGPRANDAYIAIDYTTAEKVEESTETVDTTALEATIAKADALVETSYTKASWDANKAAVDEANTAAKAALAAKESQAAVDAVNTALTEALAKLVEAGDPAELQKAIDDAKALKEEDYTYKSVNDWWEKIQGAITDAEAAIAGRESQQVLNNKLNDLNGNINRLVKAYDQTELKKTIAEAEALKEEDYTADSWKDADIKTALKTAQDVITLRGSKEDVKGSVNALKTAMDKLVAVSLSVTVGRGDFEQKLTPGTYSLPIDLLNAGHITSTKEYTSLDYMSHTSMASGCFPEAATLVVHEDGSATLTTALTAIDYNGLSGAADDWSIYENTQDFLDGKANSSTGARFNARIDKKGILAGKTKPKQISFTVPDLKQNVVATRMHIEVMGVYQDACIGLDWKDVKKVSDETSATSTVEKTYVNAPDTETQLKNMKSGSIVKLEEDVTLTDDLVIKGGTLDLNGHTLAQADNLIRIKGDVSIIDSSADKSGKITRERYFGNSYTTASISVESGSLSASGVIIDGQIGNKVYGNGIDHLDGLPKVTVNLKDCKLLNSLPVIMGAVDQSNVSFWGMSNGVNLTVDNCTSDNNITLSAGTNDDIVLKNSQLKGLSIASDNGKASVCNVTVDSMATLSIDEMIIKDDTFAGLSLDGTGDVVLENVISTLSSSSKSRGPLTISGSVFVTIRGGVYTNDNKRGYAIIAEGVAPLIESGYFQGKKATVYGRYLTPEKKILGAATETGYEGYQTVIDGTAEEVTDPVVTVYNEDGSVYKEFSSENASVIMSYVKKGQTVKLNKDFTESAEPVYRDCIFDLNGHTLTLTGGLTGINGSCHVIDSSAGKTGKFVSGSYMFTAPFSTSSSLILDNIICESSGVQQTSSSNVYIINGTKINGVTFINSSDSSGTTYVQESTWTFPEGTDGKALLTETVRSAQYTVTETGDRTYTVTASNLGKAMRSFESLDASAYTKVSYAAAKTIYDEIDATVDSELTADMIAQKAKELNDAIAALEAPASEANKKALTDAVAAAKSLKEADYTAASWKGFAEALIAAEKAVADEDLSDNTAVSTAKALADAQAKLVMNKKEAAAQSITGVATSISKTFGAKAFNLNAKANTALTYRSSNTDVVTVDAKGNVTLKGNGTATITISAEASADYKAATKTVTIKVASYKGAKKQSVTGVKTTISKKYKDKAFKLNAKAKTKLTYVSSNTKVVTVDKNGKVTIKGAGTAKITIKAAETTKYKRTSKTVTIKVAKVAPTISVKAASKSYKASALKKKAQSFKLGASANSKGKVSFKKTSGNAGIAVSSTGKVTVKKGLKKGTYKVKVRVSAAANGSYKAGSKTVTVTVKVK